MFAGTETLLLDTLRWGGAGCISATVNVTAPLSAEVLRTRSEEAQARLTARREYLERFPVVPALKAIMRQRTGEDTWHVRPPLVPLDDARTQELLTGVLPN